MAVPPPFPADKTALRRHLRAERAAEAATAANPIAVPDQFRSMLRPGLIVASYRPIGSEADPALLAAAALAEGASLALPHVVDRGGALRFLAWHPDDPLHAGPFGLEQPYAEGEEVRPHIILTPLVGFDDALNRLGQGAGHYDRAFAALPEARRIGVAFAVQRVARLPRDAWDVPLSAVITEQGWIEGKS